jgi:Domain of unknown function (DUF5666)
MRRAVIGGLAGTAMLMAGIGSAPAQEATEQFIPIGRSPGISGVQSYQGVIEAVDPQRQTVSVSDRTAPQNITITKQTRIWIDRSKQGQASLAGEFADLKVGQQIEVKFEDAQRRESAAWIKVAPQS